MASPVNVITRPGNSLVKPHLFQAPFNPLDDQQSDVSSTRPGKHTREASEHGDVYAWFTHLFSMVIFYHLYMDFPKKIIGDKWWWSIYSIYPLQ